MRGVAQRVGRVASKLKKAGVGLTEEPGGKVKEVLSYVKHYYLFAKQGEEKTGALEEIVSHSQELMEKSEEFIESGLDETNKRVKSGVKKLEELIGFTKELFPQIKGWLETGVVATEKLLHAGTGPSASYCEKQSWQENGVWLEVADKPNRGRLCFRQSLSRERTKGRCQ